MRRSGTRAFFYAYAMAMLLGCGTVLGLFAISPNAFVMAEHPAALVSMLPGLLMLGSLFAVPSAVVLVVIRRRIMRAIPEAIHPAAWGLGGMAVALPTAWLFGALLGEEPLAVPSFHTALLAFGMAAGLAARLGYRIMPAAQDAAQTPPRPSDRSPV